MKLTARHLRKLVNETVRQMNEGGALRNAQDLRAAIKDNLGVQVEELSEATYELMVSLTGELTPNTVTHNQEESIQRQITFRNELEETIINMIYRAIRTNVPR